MTLESCTVCGWTGGDQSLAEYVEAYQRDARCKGVVFEPSGKFRRTVRTCGSDLYAQALLVGEVSDVLRR